MDTVVAGLDRRDLLASKIEFDVFSNSLTGPCHHVHSTVRLLYSIASTPQYCRYAWDQTLLRLLHPSHPADSFKGRGRREEGRAGSNDDTPAAQEWGFVGCKVPEGSLVVCVVQRNKPRHANAVSVTQSNT